jgi:hypothetical protein
MRNLALVWVLAACLLGNHNTFIDYVIAYLLEHNNRYVLI